MSEAVLTDTILSLGLMICFYYGLTAIGCVWYFRKSCSPASTTSSSSSCSRSLGGIGLWFVFFETLRDSADPSTTAPG